MAALSSFLISRTALFVAATVFATTGCAMVQSSQETAMPLQLKDTYSSVRQNPLLLVGGSPTTAKDGAKNNTSPQKIEKSTTLSDDVPHKSTAKKVHAVLPKAGLAKSARVSVPAIAPVTPASKPVLSLEDAINRALKQNPEREIASAQIIQAEAGIREAKAGYYPQANLKIEGGREYNDPFSVVQGSTTSAGYNYSNNTSVNIRQMLFDGFVTKEAVEQRMAQAKSANFSRDKITEELIKNTIEIYLQLAQFQQISATAEANYRALQDIAKLVDARAQAGDTNVSEKNYMLARLANAQQEKINASSALKDAYSALRYLIGDVEDFTAEVPDMKQHETEVSDDTLLSKALRQNTDVLQNKADLTAARHELRTVTGQYYPNLNFVVDSGRAEDLGGTTGIKYVASGKVELNFKLYDGGLRSAGMQRQMGKIKEVEARGDKIQRELKQNVLQASNKLRSSAEQMAVAVQEINANTELERVYREQFRNGDGDVDVTNLVEARERIFTANVKKARLQSDTINADFALKKLVGELLLPFCGSKCP
jgi:adhesin transport system outer membrane protein